MYVDGMVTAVPKSAKQAYKNMSVMMQGAFMENGALRYVDCWADDVPRGEKTDFWRAVQAGEDEEIVFSWIEWPDKATRDAGWKKAMEDPRMPKPEQFPFDGSRMIWGGFEAVVEAAWE